MRWIGIVVGLGLVAGLAYWVWPRDESLATALPASTVSVVLMPQPRAVAQRIDGISGPLGDQLGAIKGWFLKGSRETVLGFDPAVGFAAIGLGEGGAAIARLAQLEPPVLCLDLAQPERFTAWLTQRTSKSAAFDSGALRVADQTWPLVERGAWTCLSTPKTTTAELKAAFEGDNRLIDAPLYPHLHRPDSMVQAGWSARQATRWAHAAKRPTLATDLGHLAAYVVSAVAQLDTGLTVSIHLTPEGQDLADRLFATSKAATGEASTFSRWLAMDGWGAARLSLALPSAPDALATALPPSTPATQRQAVSLGRMALPMTAGINWQQLTAALDGSLAMGFDLRVTDGKVPSLLVLGVKDQAAAEKAVKAVAKKFGEGGGLLGLGTAKSETIAGVTAWRLKFKAGDAWVHLAQGAIVVASSPEVLTAALAKREVPTGWTVLDQAGVVLGVAADLPALRARMPATAPRKGLDAKTLSLAIMRTPKTLVLRIDDRSGVHLDTLMGLGLWARGQAAAKSVAVEAPAPMKDAAPVTDAGPVKAPSPSPATP